MRDVVTPDRATQVWLTGVVLIANKHWCIIAQTKCACNSFIHSFIHSFIQHSFIHSFIVPHRKVRDYWNGRHPFVHMSVRHSVCPCVQIVSDLHFCNHLTYCFHIETGNLQEWPSDLISVPSYSIDFPPNAGLWLVDLLLPLISVTTHHISSILELWTHLSDPRPGQCTIMRQWVSAKCQPLIGRFVYAHYLHNHSLYYFHIGTVICILSCSIHFLPNPHSPKAFESQKTLWPM